MVRYNTDGGLAVAWDRRGARGDGRSLALAAGRSRVCSDAASRSGAGIQEVHESQRCRKSRVADVYVYDRWTAFFLLGQYACIRYSYYSTSVCILGLGTLASRAQFSRPAGTPPRAGPGGSPRFIHATRPNPNQHRLLILIAINK